MRKIISLLLLLTLATMLFCACGKNIPTTLVNPYEMDTTEHKLYQVEITVKDYGVIALTLDQTIAPKTVKNFISLVEDGFYDGLTFHRIISGFMIQGGDPAGNGSGGSDKEIKGEFAANGVNNPISHVRGVISMARMGENPYYGITAEMAYHSATSQFFIMHETYTGLDGQYAAFGWVTSGMEIVDAICNDTPVTDNNGTVLAKNQPVIESIRIVK